MQDDVTFYYVVNLGSGFLELDPGPTGSEN